MQADASCGRQAVSWQFHYKRNRLAVKYKGFKSRPDKIAIKNACQVQVHHYLCTVSAKKAAIKTTVNRKLALHDMKGVKIIVILRSRSLARVRVAIIAGTLQPKPISIGTKDEPESPILRSSISITKAMRAI